MNYKSRREKLYQKLDSEGYLLLCSGFEVHRSADENYPFSVNRNFFYLTGIDQKDSFLVVNLKTKEEKLFLLNTDPILERWIGAYLDFEEAKRISMVSEVYSLSLLEKTLEKVFSSEKLYLDLEKFSSKGGIQYGEYFSLMARKQKKDIDIEDVYPFLLSLRAIKEKEEIQKIQNAIHLTKLALDEVMKKLPKLEKEKEVQALFEERILALGGATPSFDTIAGSGKNATILHYHENNMPLEKKSMILLDLGARKDYYNADITRTYPIEGVFSPLQRKIYEIVLEANQRVIQMARPGVRMTELQSKTVEFLTEQCLKANLIDSKEEMKDIYFHRVSHHLGLDVHDPMGRDTILEAGNVITDEPGLYFEKYGIGVRIEDDLLIVDDGCINLSKEIIKDPDEIEKTIKNGEKC